MTARQNWSTRPVRTLGSTELAIVSTWRPGIVSFSDSLRRNVVTFARNVLSNPTCQRELKLISGMCRLLPAGRADTGPGQGVDDRLDLRRQHLPTGSPEVLEV